MNNSESEVLSAPKKETGSDIVKVATDIQSGLSVFESRKAAVAAKVEKYSTLTIKDATDKEGYKIVKEARLDLMRERTATEKEGKSMRDPLTQTNKFISAKEKELVEVSQAEELRLSKLEKDYEAEQERIKQEEIQKEIDRKQKMVDQLAVLGMPISISQLENVTDAQFQETLVYAKEVFDKKEAERIAEEKRIADEAEAERLAKEAEAKKLQDERAELDRIKAEQDKKEQELKDQQAKIDAANKKIEDDRMALEKAKEKEIEDKKRSDELEAAKAAAAEEAKLKAIQDAKDADAKRLADEQKKKEAEEKKAARQPDKVKILKYLESLQSVQFPELKTEDGKKTINQITTELNKVFQFANDIASVL